MKTTGELDKAFVAPPDSARPWVYWFWLNGNITKEGITADLEAMTSVPGSVGRCGCGVADVGGDNGMPVKFMSPQWWDLMRHAIREADRLGSTVQSHQWQRLVAQRRALDEARAQHAASPIWDESSG